MQDKEVSLWKIFSVFMKIGAFTIGGGYVIVPAISSEMSRRGWLNDEELPDIVAIAQSAPGLLAVNMSIFAGYRLKGVKGSIAATIGCIIPSFVIILIIAMAFSNFKDNPVVISVFKGIRPVVISLIAVPVVKMARTCCKKWWGWALAAGTMLGVALFGLSPVLILAVLLAVSVILAAINAGKEVKR